MQLRAGALLILASLAACSDDSQPASGSDASTPGNDASVTQDGASQPDGATPAPDAAISPAVDGGKPVTYGQTYTGGEFHLGPVDYDETVWHNACAGIKYLTPIRQVEGTLLAGLWDGIPNVAGYCDACIHVTTAKGKSATLRVVTYGATTPNSIDVSPDAYALLDSGEYPRSMTWQFAKCPDTGKLMYEFQTQASEYWTSLWVRNARVPVKSVEVKSANHASYVPLTRGTDGTLTDGSGGFGKGTFSIRTTGIDNQQVVDTFARPSAGVGGAMLTGQVNLQ